MSDSGIHVSGQCPLGEIETISVPIQVIRDVVTPIGLYGELTNADSYSLIIDPKGNKIELYSGHPEVDSTRLENARILENPESAKIVARLPENNWAYFSNPKYKKRSNKFTRKFRFKDLITALDATLANVEKGTGKRGVYEQRIEQLRQDLGYVSEDPDGGADTTLRFARYYRGGTLRTDFPQDKLALGHNDELEKATLSRGFSDEPWAMHTKALKLKLRPDLIYHGSTDFSKKDLSKIQRVFDEVRYDSYDSISDEERNARLQVNDKTHDLFLEYSRSWVAAESPAVETDKIVEGLNDHLRFLRTVITVVGEAKITARGQERVHLIKATKDSLDRDRQWQFRESSV